jgi:hypothetical protein
MAEITLFHACFAAFFATFTTVERFCGEFPTARTFLQTFHAKGIAQPVTLVETGADLAPTGATRDQAVGAEALAGSGTDAELRAVLLATWATNGTISTNERINERMRAIERLHRIGA